MIVHRGHFSRACAIVALVALPLGAQQPGPPSTGFPPAAPAQPAPAQPAPAPGAAQPAPAPAPAPTAPAPTPGEPVPGQTAPVQPAPAQPAPPVQPLQPVQPAYAPPQSTGAERPPTTSAAPLGLVPGIYAGGYFGVAGPFGNQSYGGSATFKSGPSVLLLGGYAFHPNIGIDFFFQYARTKLEYADSSIDPEKNSAWLFLLGPELRGMVGNSEAVGWASLGVAFGKGEVTVEQSEEFGGDTYKSKIEDEASFNPLPVLGIGADVGLGGGLFVGAHARWYIVSLNKACEKSEISGGGLSAENDEECTEDFDDVGIPDIVFVGLGLTYRTGM